jgi:hypothetical protein
LGRITASGDRSFIGSRSLTGIVGFVKFFGSGFARKGFGGDSGSWVIFFVGELRSLTGMDGSK